VILRQILSSFQVVDPGVWRGNWAWGLPLIVLTVVIHVLGLGLMDQGAVRMSSRMERHHPTVVFVLVMGTMTLLATALHAMEAFIWATSYQFLGAVPGYKSAMLFSLGAMTTFGNTAVNLEDRWKLMGAIEALSGWLLFGLTTAFLFGMIQKVWSRQAGGVGNR
jgi:hypothetical protein